MIEQAAAIPFRCDDSGAVLVLLIRKKPHSPWGIPKGHIERGATAKETALAEAMEEAGVEGALHGEPAGMFRYHKVGLRFRVRVWWMEVSRVHGSYREAGRRERRWFPVDRAAELVRWPDVGPMIEALGSSSRQRSPARL